MDRPHLRWDLVLRAGAIAGMVEVAAGIAMYLAGVYFAPWSGPASLLVLAIGIAVGQKWYAAKATPAPMGYLVAFAVGAMIAAITAATYVIYNFVSVSFFYPHFIEQMVAARFAQLHSPAMTQAQANELLDRLRSQITLRAIAINNFRFLAVIGSALAALLAAFTRQRRSASASRPLER